MWYEYPIPANSKKQREIIRHLRKWIQNLEKRGIIQSFAFNHYMHVRARNYVDSLKLELESKWNIFRKHTVKPLWRRLMKLRGWRDRSEIYIKCNTEIRVC